MSLTQRFEFEPLWCFHVTLLYILFFLLESLRSLAHSNYVNFNQAALHAVLKPENMSSSAQATQISVCFVCVYASSTVPFIAVSNRFSHCLDHCFRSFRSLFASISIDCKTLELNYFVFEKHAIERTSNTNTRSLRLCVRFKHGSFYRRFHAVVSFAVWITVFDSCLNLVFETFYLLPFLTSVSRPQGPFDFFFAWIKI